MPTALEMLDAYVAAMPFPASALRTGLPGLDALLSGGVCCGEVVELCGSATCGKSSVALAAACATLLRDSSATVLYIATTQDGFAARARGLLAATVGARLAAWRAGAAAGSSGSGLSGVLPRCAARRRAQGLEAEAALAAELEGKDLAAEEVAHACEGMRIAQAVDWPRLQKLLAALERDATAAAAAAAGAAAAAAAAGAAAAMDGGAPAPPPPSPQARFLAGLRLVILDALPTVIYPVLGGLRNYVGHAALSEVGMRLHRLARARCLAALVLNSVVHERSMEEGGAGEQGVRPSLGMTWSYIPDVSIHIVRQTLLLKGAGPAAPSGASAGAGGEAPALRDTLAFAVLKSARLYMGSGDGAAAQAAWDLMPGVLVL
jgi:hypothetical protein